LATNLDLLAGGGLYPALVLSGLDATGTTPLILTSRVLLRSASRM
jgi:hypothetical protein